MASKRSSEKDPVFRFLRYLHAERNASDHTCTNYKIDLERFSEVIEGKPLRDVTPFDVRRFVASESSSGVSKRTIARRLSCLRSFFRFLCREGRLRHNPAEAIPTPRLEKRLPSFLDEKQVLKLLEIPRKRKWQGWRDRAILETLYSTGMRVSECASLNIEDIDEFSGTVLVRGKGKIGRAHV